MQLKEKVTDEIVDNSDLLSLVSKAADRKPRSIIRMCEEGRHDRFFYLPVVIVLEKYFNCKIANLTER